MTREPGHDQSLWTAGAEGPAQGRRAGRWTMGGVLLAVAAVAAPQASADDLRVYTEVRSLADKQQNPPVLAQSLTLFHAGKVYDYMESVGEVVIYEPSANRFILMGSDYIATKASFAEVQQFLTASRNEAEKYIAKPPKDAQARRRVPGLVFQLDPVFQEQVRADQIRLTGQHLSYIVTTAAPPEGATCDEYLNYADWAARLNYVLHPHSLFPECRIAVNEALRREKRLPVSVELAAHLDRDMHLKATHRFGWSLQSIDRQLIDQWERKQKSGEMKWVSLHEYQQQLLTKATASAK